jgi:pimeloyl-[acyl-carrier protein] methyl ester esterase
VRAILLPGLHGTGDLFDDFRAALAPSIDATAISYPRNERLNYDHLFANFSRDLPLEPFILIAESFAGPLAIRIAAQRSLLNAFFSRRMPPFVLRAILAGRDASSSDIAKIDDAIAAAPSQVLATRVRAIADIDARADLKKVNVPILYLRGRRDRLVPKSAMRDMLKIRPDIQTRVLDSPHLVLQRRPHEAAASIAAFMQEFEPKSRARSE